MPRLSPAIRYIFGFGLTGRRVSDKFFARNVTAAPMIAQSLALAKAAICDLQLRKGSDREHQVRARRAEHGFNEIVEQRLNYVLKFLKSSGASLRGC